MQHELAHEGGVLYRLSDASRLLAVLRAGSLKDGGLLLYAPIAASASSTIQAGLSARVMPFDEWHAEQKRIPTTQKHSFKLAQYCMLRSRGHVPEAALVAAPVAQPIDNAPHRASHSGARLMLIFYKG